MYPPFPYDPASRASEQVRSAVAQSATDPDSPLLNQIEQLLGEDSEPDPAFFTESWTLGVEAASENYLRRRRGLTSRQHEPPAWPSFAFIQFVSFVAEPLSPAAQPVGSSASLLPDMRAVSWPPFPEQQTATALPTPSFRDSDAQEDESELTELAGPVTFQTACRLLGVAATSTREQIKIAYRKMASRYHPDRLARTGVHEQQRATERMASINEAYRLLCGAH